MTIITQLSRSRLRLTSLWSVLLLSAPLTLNAADADAKTTSSAPAATKPVVIETQVKGSTEQPNVTYIIPWQGIEQPITISDQQMSITLPQFQPINPKAFQQQVREFSATQSAAEAKATNNQ